VSFSDKERDIFHYHNGREWVYGDPLRVWRRLTNALDGQPNEALRAARSDIPAVREEAHEKVLAAAAYALEMAPFDPATGEGALEAQLTAALSAFLADLVKKKMTPASLPTSSGPSTSSPGPSPTPTTMASSSTLAGCGCNGLTNTPSPSP
jgi:hypothetical protein